MSGRAGAPGRWDEAGDDDHDDDCRQDDDDDDDEDDDDHDDGDVLRVEAHFYFARTVVSEVFATFQLRALRRSCSTHHINRSSPFNIEAKPERLPELGLPKA